MSKQLAPFHFDIVGSFLRPEELKEAREAFNNGNISREELTAVEDRLITDLIQKQKAAGLPVITDGEFRDRKSTRLNSSHEFVSRMPSSA